MAAWGRYLVMLLFVLLAGCGYRPMGYEAPTGQEVPTLAIPLFANRSTEVGLEAVMANAFIQTFSQGKSWRLVTQPQDADLVLEGQVQAVENTSVAYFDVTRSLVRRITVHVVLDLKRRESGKVIWKERVSFFDDYLVETDYHIGEATKAMGIRRGALTLARRIMEKVMMVL